MPIKWHVPLVLEEVLQLCATLAGLEEWCLCGSALLIQQEGFVTTRILLQSVVSAWVLWQKESSADVFILVGKH